MDAIILLGLEVAISHAGAKVRIVRLFLLPSLLFGARPVRVRAKGCAPAPLAAPPPPPPPHLTRGSTLAMLWHALPSLHSDRARVSACVCTR